MVILTTNQACLLLLGVRTKPRRISKGMHYKRVWIVVRKRRDLTDACYLPPHQQASTKRRPHPSPTEQLLLGELCS